MPFIPYIVGAAVGAVVVYVAKDDSSKQMFKDTGGKITGGVSAVTGKVTGMFKKGEEEVADDAEEKVAA